MAEREEIKFFQWQGIFGFKPYIPSLSRLRQMSKEKIERRESEWVYNFKSKGKHSGAVKRMIETLASHLGCEKILAVPPSMVKAQPNGLQDLFGRHIWRIQDAQTRKYNHKKRLPEGYGQSYIISGFQKSEKILIVDDICTTGTTLFHFRDRLKEWGCDAVPACLGFHYKLNFEEAGALPFEIDPEGDEAKDPTEGDKTEFKNALEISSYLEAEGWKVAKSTVYKHIKKAKLRPDIDKKHYSLKAVLRYAKTFLVTRETKQKLADEELARKKQKKELEKLDEEIKRQGIKRLADEGRYIPRESFELELAGRGSVLETGLKGEIQTRTAELIDLIEGNQRKAKDFVSEMFAIIDKGLNQFANNKEWQIIFQDEGSNH